MNNTLLELGFYKDNVAVLERYVQANGWDVKTYQNFDFSLLHWAVDTRALNVTRWLLDKGVDKDARGGRCGLTPLMVAAQSGFKEGIDALLAAGADRTLRDKEGRLAVDFAQEASIRKMVKPRVTTHYGCRWKQIRGGHSHQL